MSESVRSKRTFSTRNPSASDESSSNSGTSPVGRQKNGGGGARKRTRSTTTSSSRGGHPDIFPPSCVLPPAGGTVSGPETPALVVHKSVSNIEILCAC
ncbi:hypothetical protein FHG87_018029 [Trinorchestia longiramus]|nr:hypothetical protein FHG87_018029 [Trinorchestia longiramus]